MPSLDSTGRGAYAPGTSKYMDRVRAKKAKKNNPKPKPPSKSNQQGIYGTDRSTPSRYTGSGSSKSTKSSKDKPKWTYQSSHSVGDVRSEQYSGSRKPARHSSPTTFDFQDFNRYKAKDKGGTRIREKTAQKRGVLKDIQTLSRIKGAAARRAYRTKHGLYKGKYYGPDVFKGDKSLNKAWEKSGKKGSPGAFASNYRKASNR